MNGRVAPRANISPRACRFEGRLVRGRSGWVVADPRKARPSMPDNTTTWDMIHSERKAVVEMLDGLTAAQWDTPSLCTGWTVKLAAAHIVVGAEQTPARFVRGMVANGFRFNKMMDRNAHRLGVLTPGEIVERLRAR